MLYKRIMLIFLLIVLSGCLSSNTNSGQSAAPPSYDLSQITIQLPGNWHLDTTDRVRYEFIDEVGENRGGISSTKFEAAFDFYKIKPNHSEIIDAEDIDLPFGKGELFTLDMDNGPAASGRIGTHYVYYAVIPIQDHQIYLIDFSTEDKELQTKQQFIEMLKSLDFKE